MATFENTITTFLAFLQNFQGAKPVFSIDYSKKEILIKYAPGGFIKALAADEKSLIPLNENGLSYQKFN